MRTNRLHASICIPILTLTLLSGSTGAFSVPRTSLNGRKALRSSQWLVAPVDARARDCPSLVVRASANDAQSDVDPNIIDAQIVSGGRRMRGVKQRIRKWMQNLLSWQRSKRRNLLTAAALAFSVLVFSHQQQHDLVSFHAAGSRQQSATIEIVQTRGGRGFAARGGSTTDANSMPSYLWDDEGLEIANDREENAFQSEQQEIEMANSDHQQSSSPSREEQIEMENSDNKPAYLSVEEGVELASRTTQRTLREAFDDLTRYMEGPKSDTLLLLLATSLITPICQRLGTSPILGFLASGMLLGPNGFGLISGIHTTETLAELGIVFFLFEMGLELSVERLVSMKKDVFGLGFSQFIVTALTVAGVGSLFGLPANALIVLGGGLALSSSAFVLQLLKDKNQFATRFGRASFGILLFQDLAVVPLLVVTPILAGGGGGLAKAVFDAVVKAVLALTSIAFCGRVVLNPLFRLVAQSQSQEAFLGVILLTALSMSFMTEGLGLSNTLGAFLAGVLLSETKYRYQVEADIAPFRGVLLGLFFVTVGFEIDLGLIASNLPLVGSLVMGILLIKAVVTTALSLAFGLSLSTSQQTGLILSQGGEFAFVAFGLARSLGILDAPTTKLMLTCVSLSMASTPFMAMLGSKISKILEEKSDFTHYLGQDRDANEIKESDDFAVVVGYGAVGKVVCDLLDRKFIKYVGVEIDPNKAIQARNAGLPVFYGDIGRQEVAEAFNVGKAKAIIVCIADRAQCNRAVIALRRWYPNLKIFARAVNADHASRLQKTLDVAAMVPILPEDNVLLTLPFGGAVMKALGVPSEEVNAIVEQKRKELLRGKGLQEDSEELELLQLGISADTFRTMTASNTTDDRSIARKEAAAERREEVMQKSPFVASVIEEICPESANDDACDVPPHSIGVMNGNVTKTAAPSTSGNSTSFQ